MIRFVDFIIASNPKITKVKFNMNPGDSDVRAWDLLLENHPDWLAMNAHKEKHSNNNMGQSKYLISFAQYYPYGPEYYIFGGVYGVKKKIPEVFGINGYELTLLDSYKEYIKRLIIKLEKPIGRDLYLRKYENVQKGLNPEVYEIAPSTKLGHFPGYQNVSLTYNDLRLITTRNEPSWKQALSNVKGIYVVTDTSNGKLYIGSASGNNDGIWQRWCSYAGNDKLTGENKGFEEIQRDKGDYHIVDNFKYSILEIFDTKTKVETIINRENYWKRVFESKKYGMNYN
jgi:hypothetical protein